MMFIVRCTSVKLCGGSSFSFILVEDIEKLNNKLFSEQKRKIRSKERKQKENFYNREESFKKDNL